MATKKVSALTESTSPAGTEELLINDGGTSKKVTITNANKKLFSFLDANGNYIQMQKGGDIASASPTVIDTDGDYFICTGTTGFTTFTVAADRHFFLEFAAALTMTHGAGTLDLPGGANITTAASDVGEFYSTAANVVTCVNYTKADGTPIAVNIVDDTSPQLGGFLDANGNYIQTEKGGDITSADPLVIDTDGDYFDVTGTTGFSAMTVAADRQFTLQFDGALTMTHHATNLDLPGEANITTVAGDVATFQSTGANTVQCINYTKASGNSPVDSLPLAGGTMTGTVTIDQDTDNNALVIDSESTSNYGILAYAKYGLRVDQDISGGYAGKFYRNIAEAGSNPLVYIHDEHTSNTQPALKIQQDGAGIGLQIDQNGNSNALYIDSESTSNTIVSYGKFGIYSVQDISGGYAGYFYRNIAEAGSNPLITINDDHTSNTQPALKVKQDGTGAAITVEGGNIVIGTAGKGIDFSATTDGTTMSSELLDDYEEGTFTVTASSGTSITSEQGEYIKIGNLVHITLDAYGFTGGTGTSIIGIYGLPFTNNAAAGAGTVMYSNINRGSSYSQITAYIYPSNTLFRLYEQGDNNSWNAMINSQVGSTTNVIISATYIIT